MTTQSDSTAEETARVSANAWLSPNERIEMVALAKASERSLAAEMRLAVRAWLAQHAEQAA